MSAADVAEREHVEAQLEEIDPDVEEVRLALALNGGVSLAVWMGGCAVELDRARRTRRTPAGEQPPEPTLYQALCNAFRRELVIDVMSGSSAGGINGALLAGAMAHGRALEPKFLRKRWLELGDFSKLLQPLSARGPTALMRGDYFADQLNATFDQLINHEPQVVAPLTPAPALDVTTTDIGGRAMSFRDTWGGTLRARDYRARFRFRTTDDFSAEKLAHAARGSASFPFAFEPFAPAQASDLAGLTDDAYVVDGGLLDNAPIRAALDLIPSRPATRQVRRLLCYVNGEPALSDEAEAALAAQRKSEKDADKANGTPTPRDVIGIVLNLPRKAPFADQLKALQDVSRNPEIADFAEHQLLTVDLQALEIIAGALLKTYSRRRRLKALQDTPSEPAEIQLAYERLDEDQDLPWLHDTLEADRDAWPWGIDAARRVHQLALDVIRMVLPRVGADTRSAILKERVRIDGRVKTLARLRDENEGMIDTAVTRIARGEDVATALQELTVQVEGERPTIADGLADTAKGVLHVLRLAGNEQVDVGRGLFGVDVARHEDLTPEMHETFLRRVVAVEIVRRSFTDDDLLHNAQHISFGQLTPEAPDPIFTARPFNEKRQPSVDGKLCGAILGHFGAFYRRSWRANDFLWGRMDASARIVEMLVGAQRSRDLYATDAHEAWNVLAGALLGAGEEQRELLEEALNDLRPDTANQPLEDRLHEVLREDLQDAPVDRMGNNTRIICTRAVQFEILREELQHVVNEANDDFKLGCSPATLGLDDHDLTSSAGVLKAIRHLRETKCVLPSALGRGSDDELMSDLAARTIAHAGLISLGVSRTTGGRPVSPLTALRSALLPVSGAVSPRWANRLGVVAAFGAAALYLSARIAGTASTPEVDAQQLSVHELLLAVVALLVVLGTVALPTLRAVLGRGLRRWLWVAMGFLLLAVSGIGAALLATVPGPLSWAHLLVAPDVQPPWYATLLPIALGTGAAVVGPRPLRKPVEEATAVPWRGTWSLLLVLLAAVIIAAWALPELVDTLTGEWWQITTAALAFASVPTALIAVEFLPPLLAKRRLVAARRDLVKGMEAAGPG